MGSAGANEISRGNEAEGSETTIEIKIKTLDSQTYTLRVNKEVPVPYLKEQIASVTGVLSEQQRLICRGKVLKDDQLLSSYHVEDGHTLHLVSRQPVPLPPESFPSHTEADPASSTNRSQRIQVAPGIVVETLLPDQTEGIHPNINRIVTAVLGSFGVHNNGHRSEGPDVHEHVSERHQSTLGSGSMTSSTPVVPDAGMRGQSDRVHGVFGPQTAVNMEQLQPRVIPDSLTTLSQYISRLRQEYGDNDGVSSTQAGVMHVSEGRESYSLPLSGTMPGGLPTPSLLADVLSSTRELLIEQTAESLHQLERQLHNQSNVTDPAVRLSTQSNAWRNGIMFQNLGAFLLELGRTAMTLRLGQTPSEAVVNAGPAVFISQSGPNPLMVQPLPFQPGASFGTIPTSNGQTGPGLVNDVGAGFIPRHIEIHIRRGSTTARTNLNQEEHASPQQPSGQRSPTMSFGTEVHVSPDTSGVSGGLPTEPGLRLLPIRTMVAAVPGPLNRLPILGRFQHVTAGRLSNQRESQAGGEHQPNGSQTELQSGSAVQQNIEDQAADGNSTNAMIGQGPLLASSTRSFNVNDLLTGGNRNNQDTEREVPGEILQFLSSVFQGSEIHVGDAISHRSSTDSARQNTGTTGAATNSQGVEPRVSDEGVFLSNLLHQIMPFISQMANAEPNVVSAEAPNASEQGTAQDFPADAENSNVGTSRRQSDVQPTPPNSKRQKME